MTARASFDPWAELARIRAQKMPLPQVIQSADVLVPSGGTDVPKEATFATFATFGDGETRAIFEGPRVPAVAPAFIAAYSNAPQLKVASMSGPLRCRRGCRTSATATDGRAGSGAFGLDAGEQRRGGLVIRVLRHQFAPEGFGENRMI